MKTEQIVLEKDGIRSLPLAFTQVIIDEDVPAYGKITARPTFPAPEYPQPTFEYSRESLLKASQDFKFAIEVINEWMRHYGNFGYYIQFRDDSDGARLSRFQTHTELMSAVVDSRLDFSSEPFWEAFEWMLQYKRIQEAYRADDLRTRHYADYLDQLESIDAAYAGRNKVNRLVGRALSQIEMMSSGWSSLLPIHVIGRRSPRNSLKLFYSYSHKDEALRDELQKHLSVIQRSGIIQQWHDRRIGVGIEWKGEIDEHLKNADIVLLLISSDFLSSDYCYDVELELAMKRHESGDARVIPIFLRPCDWGGSRFGKLQGTPTDAKPVTTWANQDEAFTDIAKHIRVAAAEINANKSRE